MEYPCEFSGLWVDAHDGVGAALIGAIIAASGYVGKLLIDAGLDLQKRKQDRRAQLVDLRSLLRVTRTSFAIQKQHAIRLLDMLRERNPAFDGASGYEETFARAYRSFTPDENQLHSIIRGMTVNALKPTNEKILQWIQNDRYFRGQQKREGEIGALPERLSDLQTHLLLWLAKYETWIPDKPEHALVYLGDELQHGVGFPAGIDELVDQVLAHGLLTAQLPLARLRPRATRREP